MTTPASSAASASTLPPNGNDTLRQRSNNYNKGNWVYGTVGLDYDPAEHHSFSLAGAVDGYRGSSTQNLFSQDVAPFPVANPLYFRNTKSLFSGLNVEGTGTYAAPSPRPAKEWSALSQYALNNGTFGYDFDQFSNSHVPLEQSQADYRERSRAARPATKSRFQTDFTQPFGDKRTLEVGCKSHLPAHRLGG
ncbi:MAG: hypothetical protein WKG07_00565 [Hymenobacter sp.]